MNWLRGFCLVLPALFSGALGVAGEPAPEGVEIAQGGRVSVKDCRTLSEAEFREIRKLETTKTLAFGAGLDDAKLGILAGLPAVESIVTNQMTVSDAGIGLLATFPALRNATFFHPGKTFTGQGLAGLAALPNLETLTVAGSLAFSDAGLAAVAELSHLKQFRTWHTGVTTEGIKALRALKELKSLTVGQSLSMQPPAALRDESVAALAEISSLESLTLQEARLSLPALLQLKRISHLRRLNLDGIDLSESDLAELQKQLPAVEIKWTPPSDSGRRRIESLFGPR